MRLVVPVLCVALSQLTPPRSVPPFDDVMAAVGTVLTSSSFAGDLSASGGRWVAGLALALLIGVPLGAAMGRSRTLTRLVEPALVAGFPVPKAALILLFVLWWGAGETSRVAIVVVGALIPIVVAAQHGAAGVPDALLWAAGTRRRRTVLLAALPQILSGLRIALAIAVFTVLASELLIRGTGLGAAMFTALDNGQTVTVFALASIVAGLGFAEAVFPILLATAAGTSQVTPQLRWSAASLGTRRIWLKVTIPAALPSILTGARIGLVGAIVGVFLAEMIAGADGLGHQMSVAYRTLDTPAMYAAVITVSIIGLALDRTLALARARLLTWA